MRFLPVWLALLAFAAAAGEPPTRPSARLLKAQPQVFVTGSCVIYQENGGGGVSDTEYFVRGRVVAAARATRRLAACPEVSGRSIEQYSRAEFNRLALAYPCLSGSRRISKCSSVSSACVSRPGKHRMHGARPMPAASIAACTSIGS